MSRKLRNITIMISSDLFNRFEKALRIKEAKKSEVLRNAVVEYCEKVERENRDKTKNI